MILELVFWLPCAHIHMCMKTGDHINSGYVHTYTQKNKQKTQNITMNPINKLENKLIIPPKKKYQWQMKTFF